MYSLEPLQLSDWQDLIHHFKHLHHSFKVPKFFRQDCLGVPRCIFQFRYTNRLCWQHRVLSESSQTSPRLSHYGINFKRRTSCMWVTNYCFCSNCTVSWSFGVAHLVNMELTLRIQLCTISRPGSRPLQYNNILDIITGLSRTLTPERTAHTDSGPDHWPGLFEFATHTEYRHCIIIHLGLTHAVVTPIKYPDNLPLFPQT